MTTYEERSRIWREVVGIKIDRGISALDAVACANTVVDEFAKRFDPHDYEMRSQIVDLTKKLNDLTPLKTKVSTLEQELATSHTTIETLRKEIEQLRASNVPKQEAPSKQEEPSKQETPVKSIYPIGTRLHITQWYGACCDIEGTVLGHNEKGTSMLIGLNHRDYTLFPFAPRNVMPPTTSLEGWETYPSVGWFDGSLSSKMEPTNHSLKLEYITNAKVGDIVRFYRTEKGEHISESSEPTPYIMEAVVLGTGHSCNARISENGFLVKIGWSHKELNSSWLYHEDPDYGLYVEKSPDWDNYLYRFGISKQQLVEIVRCSSIEEAKEPTAAAQQSPEEEQQGQQTESSIPEAVEETTPQKEEQQESSGTMVGTIGLIAATVAGALLDAALDKPASPTQAARVKPPSESAEEALTSMVQEADHVVSNQVSR